MLISSVISIDIYKTRKKIHLFSMAGQLHGFFVELFYILCMLSYRFLGKKFVLTNRYSNSPPDMEFYVVDTL